jgi:hypothetical protein
MSMLLMVATAFQWFADTKVGRIVGLVAVVLAAAAVAYFKVKAIGRAEEREKNRKETDDFIADKEKIDADIANDSDADLADRVRPWVSKGRK